MKQIVVKAIAYGSYEYATACVLRDRVLRQPLGLTLGVEDTAGEDSQLHVAAFLDDRLVGCLIAVPASRNEESGPQSARLRQIAVEPECQREGVGTRLMEYVEQEFAGSGVEKLWLHARTDAAVFYSRLGYTPEGAVFEELGIPHQEMVKYLSPDIT